MTEINRLKEVLAEEGRSEKWLAGKLGKDPAIVSRWCNNHIQPSLETIDEIAQLLDRKNLINNSKKQEV